MFNFMRAPKRLFLAFECALLFVIYPIIIALHPTKVNVHLSLWIIALYTGVILHKTPGFSWAETWSGFSLSSRNLKMIAIRFALSTLGIIFLAKIIAPERLFSFPFQRPGFWLLVMVLYPFLSALPQELIFRSFFFRRYAPIFKEDWMMVTVSAALFGFIHVVFHNPISPLLSLLCGFFIAGSYLIHRSLKIAAIEHALYGDMVFTVGLGFYFLVGHIPV